MTVDAGGSGRAGPRRASKRGRRRYRQDTTSLPSPGRVLAAVAAAGSGGSPAPDSPDEAAHSSEVTAPAEPTDPGAAPGTETPPPEPSEESARHLRHRSAVDELRRSRLQMVAALGVLTVAGVLLTWTGVNQMWSTTAGQYISPGLSPDDPNYVALVTPTPTLLVASADDDGALVGVSVISLHSGDEGGAVIVLPVATGIPALESGETPATGSGEGDDVPLDGLGDGGDGDDDLLPADDGDMTLADAYDSSGAGGVREGVERILRVALSDTIEVDDAGWTSLLAPVEPLSLVVPDPVGDRWPAGPLDLDAEEVGEFLAANATDDSELVRVARQELLWQTWIPAVVEAGEEAVPGEQDAGLGRFVRGLAAGDATVTGLPVVSESEGEDVPDSDGEQFTVEPEVIADIVARDIPYPQEPWAGSRIRVKLLNGTTDVDMALRAAGPLVRAQAEIAIMGNAGSFEEPRTRFLYRGESQRQAANALRSALGVGVVEPEPVAEDPHLVDEGERVDVTVVLGADAAQAIRRLEATD